MKFRIGTRRSLLAKVQSTSVKEALEEDGLSCELVEIESEGDRDHTQPLYEMEPASPGLFTKQLEHALERNQIDLAVHSLKDLPTDQPAGLMVAAIPKRVEGGDCLVLRTADYDPKVPLFLPKGAKVGTSSLRREAQVAAVRKDLKTVPIRGNVPTRAEHVRSGRVDAVILAEAGISRLKLSFDDKVRIVALPLELFIPAPGQGALAIETRADIPAELAAALKKIHDEPTALAVGIERRILKELHGGCTLPLGVRCTTSGKKLHVRAFLGLHSMGADGRRAWTSFPTFDITDEGVEVVVGKTVEFFKKVYHAGH